MVADAFVLRDDLPNVDILDAIRGANSTDYQLRIPSADKAGLRDTVNALMDPNNRRWKNEFIDSLVNRIGLTIARSNSWTNPLAPFKRGMLNWGNTIEEIQVGLLRAHNYDPDADYMEKTLFGRETPEVQANFHTVNRQDFYKVTVNEALLSRAFLDPTGLQGFVNQLMEAPSTSDQLDEFLLTCSLFKEYESNGGFFHVQVPDVTKFDTDNAQDARFALRKMRAYADTLKFLSTKYNAANMPVFAKAEDLVLFVTPEFNAAIDVEALAGAFNIEKADMHGRTVVIPQERFGITGCQAIMTTEEFFVIADQKFESSSQWNPANLHNNYFLHHWEVVSCSRFAPSIMFTTEQDDEVITVYVPPTAVSAISILPDGDGNTPTAVFHGGVIALAATVTPASADQGISWSVTGGGSGTYISPTGVLHLGANDPVASGGHVTVTATTTSINPDLPYTPGIASASLNVTVGDAPLGIWPNTGALAGITVAGHDVPAFVAGTHTYALNVPAGTVVEADDVYVSSVGPVSVSVSVAGPNGSAPQYVVTIHTVSVPDGATVDYTVNVTEV
jgi:hypothetical protein